MPKWYRLHEVYVRRWFWLGLTRLATLALVLYLGWQAWDYFGPRKPEISPLRKQVADQLVPAIVEDLRKSRGDIRSVRLLHFENDPSDYLTDQVRYAIEGSGILDLHDRTFGEKLRNALRLRHSSFGLAEAALKRARAVGAEGVIFGAIHTFESYPGGAKLDVEIGLGDIVGQKVVFERRYVKEVSPGLLDAASIQEQVTKVGPLQRLLGWLVIVLLLPVFTITFIRTMVRKESNKVNATTLAIYTGVDALLAYLLLGVAFTSLVSILLFLVVVGAAFAYNMHIMTFALRLEQ